MRTAWSRPNTKILPSPIWPVFAAARDRLDDLVDLIGRAGDFELDLRQEAHGIFGAAIDFGVALLAAVAFDLGDGQPLNADFGQRVADLVELERLDDGHDDFHWFILPLAVLVPHSTRRPQARPMAAGKSCLAAWPVQVIKAPCQFAENGCNDADIQ